MVEDKGVRVLIDPKAVLFLLGTEMGYKVEKLAAQFVFNNPNQTSEKPSSTFRSSFVPADGTGAASYESGDFDTSPF